MTRARRGFTLVEAVATIVVLAVLGSVTTHIVVQSTDAYVEAYRRLFVAAEAASAPGPMEKEIRAG